MKILILILLLTMIFHAKTVVTKCSLINAPGEYVLERNFNTNGADRQIDVPSGSGTVSTTCIFINSSNVHLNCQGHTILGYTGSDAEILLNYNGVINTSISNCIINESSGIHIEKSSYTYLENLEINQAGGGIGIVNSNNTHLVNITFMRNNRALRIQNSKNSTISQNIAMEGIEGFIIDSTDLTLENNEASHNSETGFYITSKSKLNNVILKNNKANFNKEGFKIESIENVVFENNEANNNSGEGIIFNKVDNLKMDSVLASGNSAGIRVSGPSKEVTITNSNSLNNRFLGISTYQIEKLKLENILSCGNKLNDTSLKESTYSKSKITCDKSNPPGLCDFSCPNEIPTNSSTNPIPIPDQKGCLGSVLLIGLFLLIFRRG